MSNLQVGQKVVCINRRGWQAYRDGSNYLPPNVPHPDVVYTVRSVVLDPEGEVGLLLNEVRNEPVPPYLEQHFMAAAFRPVVERKTDISIFQAMLTPKQVPVEVA